MLPEFEDLFEAKELPFTKFVVVLAAPESILDLVLKNATDILEEIKDLVQDTTVTNAESSIEITMFSNNGRVTTQSLANTFNDINNDVSVSVYALSMSDGGSK
jgi:hypothetical protein